MQLPNRWREVLTAIQARFPEAIIAGGALRDLDHGKGVKDVDIFIADRGVTTYDMLVEAFGYPGRVVMDARAAEYLGSIDEVLAVFEFPPSGEHEVLGSAPFQIVVLPWYYLGNGGPEFAERTLARFDFGICRIAHDGVEITISPAYKRDKDNKTLTLLRCENERQLDRSLMRLERLERKYPGYEFLTDGPLTVKLDKRVA